VGAAGLPFTESQIAAFFLVMARLTPLFIFAPFLSSRSLSFRVRGITLVALSIGLSPVVLAGQQLPVGDAWALAGLIGKELLVGAGFAFAVGAVLAAVQVAGTMLDTLIGFSYGGLVDPITGNQSAVLSQAYSLIGVLVFLAIGGEQWLIEGLVGTYDVVALDETPSIAQITRDAVAAFSGIFAAAVQVAGPVLLALVLTDAAFGVVSRVVPQMNVFAVGFAAKVVVGLLVVAASIPFLSGWMAQRLAELGG
jgi:flagellar biosynthesis protein FliR